MRVSRRFLHVAVPVWALFLVGAGLLLGTGVFRTGLAALDADPPGVDQLAIAVAIVTVAQLARLKVRVGTTTVAVAWGEASIIVLCTQLPATWVAAALVVGVSLANVVMTGRGDRPDGVQIVYATASRTVAGVAAVVVANAAIAAGSMTGFAAAFADAAYTTYDKRLTPLVAVALCLGALTYTAVSAAFIALHFVTGYGGRVRQVFANTITGKLPMLVGNIGIGLVVVVVLDYYDWRWLVLLPPALWLIHQTYTHRLRGDDERRTWQAFAEATRELNRLDLRDAATAGLRGALRMFPASSALLLVQAGEAEDGQRPAEGAGSAGVRCYRGELDGADVAVEEYPPSAVDSDPNVAIRSLMVGGVHVGELRLRLRVGAKMRNRDLLMFAAYGDALAAALHDATTHDALRVLTERTHHDAVHDPLTGLANRTGFMSRGDLVVRTLPPDVPVALLLLDLDHFREVNDTLGHAAGDELIQVASRRLLAALAPGELPARLGGDEFAVLFAALPPAPGRDGGAAPLPAPAELAAAEHPHQLAHALARARQLAETLATPSEVAGVQLSMEASLGVVVAAAGTADLTELLRRADVAMYQAKRGGSSVAWYDPTRDPASTDKLALLAELREALACGDQLTLVIQPAVPIAGGAAISAEALVRWHHPRRGILAPDEFLRVVEHSELIGPLTRYVLDRALEIAAGWAADGLDLPVSVNLSPRSLLDPRLPRDVAALLGRRRVRPDRLILEITETVVTSELEVIDQVLRKLRDLGVQLAVDDFGSGYSSLTFLTRVPVDEVKVDGTFVRRMVDSPEAAAIVRTTVDLGRQLGVRVVAEGVETAEQRAALTELGCTAAQGFLFQRPMPPERATEVLHDLARAAVAPVAGVRRLRVEGGAS